MNAKYDSGRVCNKREKRLAMEIIKPISIFRKCVDICGHIIIRCINMRIYCNKGEIIQADMMTRPQSKGLIWYVQFGIWLKGFTSLHFFSIFVQMVRVLLFFCCFANFSWQTFIFLLWFIFPLHSWHVDVDPYKRIFIDRLWPSNPYAQNVSHVESKPDG